MSIIKSTTRKKILIINASPDRFRSIANILDNDKYKLSSSDSMDMAITSLDDESFDLLIICEVNPAEGAEFIKKIKFSFPWLETLVITNDNNLSDAKEIIHSGAYDCLLNDFTSDELLFKVEKAIEHNRMKTELITLRQQVAMNYGFDNIIGISKSMLKLKETVKRIASTEITILLSGAYGTGKELIARVIHNHSLRRKNKFTIVDCSSIPSENFESELFGKSPALNDAGMSDTKGILLKADGGTLFFKEIDRLPLSIQLKLHRFLQDYTVTSASHPEGIKIDVRIIAATEKDLNVLIKDGQFSEDLFYLLSVLPLNVPSLADRTEDIELLTDYFLRQLAYEMNRPSFTISRKALDLLINHHWQGNVRELENTLKRATTLCQKNHLDIDDIIFIVSGEGTPLIDRGYSKTILKRKEGLLNVSQRSIIIKALSDNNWNFTQTAQDLGIGRTTLWRKVKKYNLKKNSITN